MFKLIGTVLLSILFASNHVYAESSVEGPLKIIWTTPQKISIIRTSELVDQDLATLKTVFDAELARNKNVIAATNGSFFGYNDLVKNHSTKNLGPTCLYIEKGRRIFPYENPSFCNTRYVAYITNDKRIGVLPDSEFKTKFKDYNPINYAIEGVGLIDDGKAIKLPESDIEYSYQHAHPGGKQRNGICIKEDNSVGLFYNTTKITLEELSKKLIEQGCKYAVNLDGGGTSSMYLKNGNQYFKTFADDVAKNNICKNLHGKQNFQNVKSNWEGCIMNAIFISK